MFLIQLSTNTEIEFILFSFARQRKQLWTRPEKNYHILFQVSSIIFQYNFLNILLNFVRLSRNSTVCYLDLVPTTYEELKRQLNGHTDDDQLVILDRIQKYNHPSLADDNKDKLQVSVFILYKI